MARAVTYRAAVLVAAGMAVLLPARAPWAQEIQEPVTGVRLTLDLNTTLRAHSNQALDPADPGATYRGQTALTFGLLSETRTQRLALTLGTVLRYDDSPTSGTETSADDPLLSLSYLRDAARSRVGFDASYRRGEVNAFALAFDPKLGTLALISDSGTRTQYSARAGLALGTMGPVQTSLVLSTRGLEYAGTSSTALFDQRFVSASLDTELQLSELWTGVASVSGERSWAEDAAQTMRETRAASLGLTHVPNVRTRISATLGGRHIDDSVTGETEAVEGGLSVARALPRGQLTGSVSRALTSGGVLDRAELRRQFELPAAQVELAIGVTDTDVSEVQPSFDLRYSQELKRGALSASVSSSVSVDDQAQVQQAITSGLDYAQFLTSQSELRLAVSVVDINNIGNTALEERQRGRFSATYTQALVRDWALSAGAERRYLRQSRATTWDTSVFLGLSRRFDLRP